MGLLLLVMVCCMAGCTAAATGLGYGMLACCCCCCWCDGELQLCKAWCCLETAAKGLHGCCSSDASLCGHDKRLNETVSELQPPTQKRRRKRRRINRNNQVFVFVLSVLLYAAILALGVLAPKPWLGFFGACL